MSDLHHRVKETHAILTRIARDFTPAVFASSLAAEDMVLTDLILKAKLPIAIFSLETGRLHAETLSMVERVKEAYDYDIALYRPQPEAVERYVADHGLNAFYDSVEMRKECCRIRKVEPLNRALSDVGAWVTGQRREQSVTRAELHEEEQDEARGIAKYNPLADWTEADVWAYLGAFEVPVNPLHARGYPSIGSRRSSNRRRRRRGQRTRVSGSCEA